MKFVTLRELKINPPLILDRLAHEDKWPAALDLGKANGEDLAFGSLLLCDAPTKVDVDEAYIPLGAQFA